MKSRPISTLHLVAVLIGLLVAGLVWRWQRDPVGNGVPRIVITAVVSSADTYQIFLDDGQGYSPDRVLDLPVHGSADEQLLTFNLPAGTRHFQAFRFDPGDRSALLRISRVELVGPYDRWTWEGQGLIDLFATANRAELRAMQDGRVELACTGQDPWIGTGKDMLLLSAEVLSGRPPLIRAFVLALVSLVISYGLVLLLHRIWRRLSLPGVSAPRPSRALVVLLCIDVFVLLAVMGVVQRIREQPSGLQLRMQLIAGEPDVFQLFYSDRQGEFDQQRSVFTHTLRSEGPQWVTFKLPPDSLPKFLRFDPGSLQDSLIIQQAELVLNEGRVPVELKAMHMAIGQRHQVGPVQLRAADMLMPINGDDPFLYLGLDTSALTEGLRYRTLPLTWALLSALLAVSLVHAGLWRSARFQAFVQHASTRNAMFAVSFLMLLTVPLTVTFNPVLEPPQNFSEKRTLAKLPELDLRGLGGYAAQYDTWYRDHFGFRGELFRWNSLVHIAVLRTSPLPDKVMVGRNRWLYQYHTLLDGYYRGLPAFSAEEMERVRKLCEQRQQWLAARGIRYYILNPADGGHRVSGASAHTLSSVVRYYMAGRGEGVFRPVFHRAHHRPHRAIAGGEATPGCLLLLRHPLESVWFLLWIQGLDRSDPAGRSPRTGGLADRGPAVHQRHEHLGRHGEHARVERRASAHRADGKARAPAPRGLQRFSRTAGFQPFPGPGDALCQPGHHAAAPAHVPRLLRTLPEAVAQ